VLLVSFVMSSYNYGRFVGKAIDSLLGQDARDIEVVVVENGSTDETLDVIARRRSDRRLRVIELAENIGHVAANNLGLSEARGEFVGIVDADDCALRSDAVSRQLELFNSGPDVGLVYSAHVLVDGDGQELSRAQPWPTDYVNAGLAEFEQLMWSNYIPHSGTLLRRDAVERLGPYKTNLPYAGDWERWLRTAARWSVGYVAEPLYAYRVHDRNMHHRSVSPRAATDELIRTLENAFAELPGDAVEIMRQRRAVMRHALFQTGWVDFFHRRLGRTVDGMRYAVRRDPPVVASREFWGLLSRVALAAARRSLARPAPDRDDDARSTEPRPA